MTVKEKQKKIKKLWEQASYNTLIERFFDLKSNKMLDEKIDVLQRYLNGEPPGKIPNFFDVLEFMPKDEYDEKTGKGVKVLW